MASHSLSQKQSCFVEELMKNKNFSLYSENYYCGIKFYLNGSARIEGIMWPEECSTFNQNLSSFFITGEVEGLQNYLHFLQTSILTTVNIGEIQENLGIDFDEAVQIQNLAQKYQIKNDIEERYLPLPSYETMFIQTPSNEASLNLLSSEIFIARCKRLLLNLSHEQKMSLTTEEWLEHLSSSAKFDIIDDAETVADELEQMTAKMIKEVGINAVESRLQKSYSHQS